MKNTCGPPPPGRSSQQNRPFERRQIWSKLPNAQARQEQRDERQKGYLARLLDVPYNWLKMLPHLGPELPSPLESFFSKGRLCCELLHAVGADGKQLCCRW
jgi:hypothetical protein